MITAAPPTARRRFEHQQQALQNLARRVAARGARTVLLDDVGELDVEDPLVCQRRPWRPFPADSCFKSLATLTTEQARLDQMGHTISRAIPSTSYVSLRHLYCDSQQRCGPFLGTLALYSDANHLTLGASRIGARVLAHDLCQLLLSPYSAKPSPPPPA